MTTNPMEEFIAFARASRVSCRLRLAPALSTLEVLGDVSLIQNGDVCGRDKCATKKISINRGCFGAGIISNNMASGIQSSSNLYRPKANTQKILARKQTQVLKSYSKGVDTGSHWKLNVAASI